MPLHSERRKKKPIRKKKKHIFIYSILYTSHLTRYLTCEGKLGVSII